MKIFIDTSAFIRHFYGLDDAIKLLNFAVNENEAVTAHNVIEETFFKPKMRNGYRERIEYLKYYSGTYIIDLKVKSIDK